MWAPDAQAGVQFAAVKFLQRVILVQSRGVADPRVSVTFPFFLFVCLYFVELKMSVSCYYFPSSPFKSCKTKMTQTFRMSPETTRLSMPLLSKPKALLCCSV